MHNCKLDSLRGYSYTLLNTLIYCPYYINGGIFMPLANSLQFFDGKKTHSVFECKREISAIEMKGHFICIGQKASPGQLISAILLDIRAIQKPKIFNYQKTQINFITVSPDGQFICSIGSSSQGTVNLNVIQVNNQSQVGTCVFFSRAFKKKDGKVKGLKFSNDDPTFFVVLTETKVILMRIDIENQSVEEVEVKTSKVREYNNIIFAPNDKFLYGCSKNGDIAQISIEQNKQSRIGPRKRVITKGIQNIKYLHPGYLIITGKQGLIALIQISTMALLKQIKLQNQQIYSLTEFHSNQCYFSTNKANIYRFDAKTFDIELCYSSHTSFINDVAFMKDFQAIFATCSGNDIIIWKTRQLKPIIKIALAKVICMSLCLPKNGKFILSGWDDDCIRIFSPANGKIIHKINPVNLQKVTKIITDQQSTRMICGGQNGMIRLWNIQDNKMFGLILGSLAFHLRKVNNLKMNPYNPDQLVSSGDDGNCAIWSLSKFQLRNSFYIASFIKEINFISEIKIAAVGCGSYIYQCLTSNGQIVNKIEVNGTSINTVAYTTLDATDQKLLLYGGDDPYLNYIEASYGGKHINKLRSYGVINKIQVACDKANMIAVTQNGVILKYAIFAIKSTIDQNS